MTVMEEDIKNHDFIGSDTLYFPLLYNEGKGLQGNFPIFNQKGLMVGTVNLSA